MGEETVATLRELTKVEEVDQLLQESHEKRVFVFKHSTICPISERAWNEYQDFVKTNDRDGSEFTLVMIRDHRDVSNAIAEKTGVKHESPQVILLADGKAVWDDSHYEITTAKLGQVVMMDENDNLGD
jgi:bacillithiol system protein YtxJ